MTTHHLQRVLTDRAGNFGIMTAILLPVLIGAAGVALDLTNALQVKNNMQSLIDAAALATTSAMADKDMTKSEAETFAKNYFISQAAQATALPNETAADKSAREAKLNSGIASEATITNSSGNAQTFDIKMTMNYAVPLTGLSSVLGMKSMNIKVSSASESGREGNALSMYLALDESGSMAYDTTTVNSAQPTKQESYNCSTQYQYKTCYRTVPNYLSKMASLKAAAAGMFAELNKADPTSELIRMGADSYTHETKTEEKMGWGTTKVAAYVNKLPDPPAGGTDASGAMTNALNALKVANATEKTAQNGKGNTSFERFIVLMTDGEMTGYSASWNSTLDKSVRALCDKAKADKDASGSGIKIYTVAFMAPDKGKSLLNYCASGEDYYYEPDDMTSLVQSFGDIARKAAKTATRLTN